MKKSYLILLIILGLVSSLYAQRVKPADETELAGIEKRGKMLAEYDQAAWHSTDAVMALSPKKGSFQNYLGAKNGDKWTVVYGKLNDTKDKYLISYEAVQQAKPEEFKVQFFENPKEDTGFFLNAAKSQEIAKAAFVPAEKRPYNFAVLPATDGQFFVYFMPAQTQVGIFPLGGDVRFLVSKDGSKILETRQLHKAIIEFQVPENVKPETSFHIAVLDNVPEDTDVFHVLAREPKVAELVVTQKYVYQVEATGKVIYIMTTEAFRKIGKQGN